MTANKDTEHSLTKLIEKIKRDYEVSLVVKPWPSTEPRAKKVKRERNSI